MSLLPRLRAVLGALVPDVGFGDGADCGEVARMANQLAARIRKAPLADVDRKTEPRDERAASEVRILVVATGLGARLLDEALHHPRRHVTAVTRIHVAERLQLREQQRPVRSDAADQALPVQDVA